MRTAFRVAAPVLAVLAAAAAGADPPPRVRELEAEIAKTRQRLNALTAELDRLRGRRPRVASAQPLRLAELTVGDCGEFVHAPRGPRVALKVAEIIGDDEMVLRPEDARLPAVLVRGRDTRGLAEDRRLELTDCWEVTGTRRHRGRTYYVLEPIIPRD